MRQAHSCLAQFVTKLPHLLLLAPTHRPIPAPVVEIGIKRWPASCRKLWDKMDESVEKSCWGITLWTIAIVLAVAVIGSFVMGPDAGVSATTSLNVSG